MTTTIAITLGIGLALGLMIGGLCVDVERCLRENAERRDEQDELRDWVAAQERSMQTLARRLTTADTGPIAVTRPQPRPTTIPGIPSARPEVPRTGSTASEVAATTGPRHRATKKKAS